MSYISTSDLKAYARITKDDQNDQLDIAIAAASGHIDQLCGRTFGSTESASERTFDVERDGRTVLIDDAVPGTIEVAGSVTELPRNAAAVGRPVTSLVATSWPSSTVVVSARWGWPEVPFEIAQATLILAFRLFKRHEAPEGISSFGDGVALRMSHLDPDVAALISPYRKLRAW